MSPDQKVRVAEQLDALGVDIVEAGFPAASPADFDGVRCVGAVLKQAATAALARCSRGDIEQAARALEGANEAVLHVFVATSDIHLKHKLRKSRTEVVESVSACVSYARSLCARVEFSAEDATRSDWDYLACVCDVAAQAGASTINLPDTVGYALPQEYAAMFRYVRERVRKGAETVFSAHCHDDLGLATANTLAAIEAGARQVEVTVNGLGERAGNAPLEEVVMALKTRSAALGGPSTGINTPQLVPASSLVSEVTGLHVQVNKAVVGRNAFAHEAGIHQDGVLKERTTYEIMRPADVGWTSNRLVLGRHSGRHGVVHRLSQLGITLHPDDLERVYAAFLETADRTREVHDEALLQIVTAACPAPAGAGS
jgi:2-isopropylmalate synthase